MAHMKQVSSRHNPTIKHLRALSKAKQRSSGAGGHEFIVEGVREASRVLEPPAHPWWPAVSAHTVLFSETRWPELINNGDPEAKQLLAVLPPSAEQLLVPDELLRLISVRQNPAPAVVHASAQLAEVPAAALAECHVVLVLDQLEKPGNVGAVIRSATAAGVDLVVLCHDEGGRADPFNPHAIRASTGTVFRAPLVARNRTDLQRELARSGHQIVLTTPHTKVLHTGVAWNNPSAIVLGSEAHGAHDSWFAPGVHAVKVRIPMAEHGPDSLNVSVAGALVLYEAVRNRLL